MDVLERVIARVSANEGRFDSLNLNRDGAGLSVGILQWAQRPGALGMLLRAQQEADPEVFARVYGPSWEELLVATREGGLRPVAGAPLWTSPWVERFREAGRLPGFQAVQLRLAVRGPYAMAARTAALTLGTGSERALALFYDTAVQQGPGHARTLATRVQRMFAGMPAVTERSKLLAYAQLAPAHFRRVAPPTGPYPVAGIEWRMTGGEWHAWAGQVDLYRDVLRRRMAILNDPGLSDAPLPTPDAERAAAV